MPTERRQVEAERLGLCDSHVQVVANTEAAAEVREDVLLVFVTSDIRTTTALTTVVHNLVPRFVMIIQLGAGAYTFNGLTPTHQPAIFVVCGSATTELAQVTGT